MLGAAEGRLSLCCRADLPREPSNPTREGSNDFNTIYSFAYVTTVIIGNSMSIHTDYYRGGFRYPHGITHTHNHRERIHNSLQLCAGQVLDQPTISSRSCWLSPVDTLARCGCCPRWAAGALVPGGLPLSQVRPQWQPPLQPGSITASPSTYLTLILASTTNLHVFGRGRTIYLLG